jgi:hypothetical protein
MPRLPQEDAGLFGLHRASGIRQSR